ncbi:hypothetical protein [Haloferula sp. BvORR071]|uniref:hypothetical protein n=1 Tax=Haloferula sp. BvORR071 TaxID=1396141 RepID=UPI00055457D9|nr:hypothetical protein [Haloferula sp. BvORR071]
MKPLIIPDPGQKLLQSFNHLLLGEGDPVAGMNVLVSMCAALSAAAGPDARIVDDNIELAPAMHWLTGGSLSPVLHEQLVIAPIRELQNAFSDNILLASLKMPGVVDAKRPLMVAHLDVDHKASEFTPGLLHTAQDSMLLEQIQAQPNEERNFTRVASQLLKRGALHDTASFYTRNGFFHEGSDAKMLSHQLRQTHRGYPLVDFPMATRHQAAASGATLLGVMDGRGLPSATPLHVRGITTARLGQGLLDELVADGSVDPWLNRMLWLTDMPAGKPPSVDGIVAIGDPAKRYKLALENVLSHRLGEQRISLTQGNLLKHHQAFVRHLGTFEGAVPGIVGALKNLLPMLCFGLRQIVAAAPAPAGFTLDLNGVMPLARHLAARMARAATLARYADQMRQREKLAAKFCILLAERPHTARELVRRHDKLPIVLCREVLAELQAAGRVASRDDVWHLVRPAIPPNPKPLVIDVG